jgi:hypothetical protein
MRSKKEKKKKKKKKKKNDYNTHVPPGMLMIFIEAYP